MDENGELLVKNSELVIDDATQQHVNHIIIAQKGEFKETPSLGFGIDNWWKRGGDAETIQRDFKNSLEKELRSVGYKNAKVTVGDTILNFEVDV